MRGSLIIRRLAHVASGGPSAAPVFSTGIEHATSLKKVNTKPVDWKEYKCSEYLHFSKYSYYDPEVSFCVFCLSFTRITEIVPIVSCSHKSSDDVLFLSNLLRGES